MKKKIIQQSIAIIIYARLNSKRLPQKVLLKINSKPLLALIIDRIEKKSKYKIPIIVATSKAESDNKLEKFCKKHCAISHTIPSFLDIFENCWTFSIILCYHHQE